MEDLYYQCPTGVYFTSDAMEKAGSILKERGYKKAVLIYGGSSLKKSGQYSRLLASLKANDISVLEKGGVKPNPDISFIRSFIPSIRAFSPDVILAVGGGSVIDTAKNLAEAYYYDGDSLDFNKKTAVPKKALPLGVILTIAAAGSEMSDSCVISDYQTGFKSGFNNILNRPTFSILDPSLTYSVPISQTCFGLVDIISHSFERYFSPSEPYELCDKLALAVMADIVEITPVLLNNPDDKAARRSMMIASTVSHNGWTNFGKKMRFPIHAVEHQISGKHPEVPHGLGLRFLLNEFIKANAELYKDKIIAFGEAVLHVKATDAEQVCEAFEAYLASLPIPDKMEEIGISSKEAETYLVQLKMPA